MKKHTIIVTVIAVLIVAAAVTIGTYANDKMMEKVASKMEAEEMKDKAMEETYTLKFLSGINYQPGRPESLEFTVVDKDGRRLNQNEYKLQHERRMHLIVASSDLSQFQHVHPVFDTNTNSYKLPGFVFPVAGEYRLFTDFEVDAHGMDEMAAHSGVQYQDVIVGNVADFRPQPLGQPTTKDTANGNVVDLNIQDESNTTKRLDFIITRDGQKITDLQNYLGALGHLVVLRQGDLEYIHTHALTTDVANQTGTVSFEVDFTKPGTYKAFAQFQRDGKVMTTSFVINVK